MCSKAPFQLATLDVCCAIEQLRSRGTQSSRLRGLVAVALTGAQGLIAGDLKGHCSKDTAQEGA